MPTYNESVNNMPSLADMIARMKANRAARQQQRNPGERPPDAMGRQAQVGIEGEAPIQAQPVGQRQGLQQLAEPQYNVGVGPVTQTATLPPMRFQVQGQPPAQTQAQPGMPGPQAMAQQNQGAQQDPRNMKLRQLMSQGMPFEEAMRMVQAGG